MTGKKGAREQGTGEYGVCGQQTASMERTAAGFRVLGICVRVARDGGVDVVARFLPEFWSVLLPSVKSRTRCSRPYARRWPRSRCSRVAMVGDEIGRVGLATCCCCPCVCGQSVPQVDTLVVGIVMSVFSGGRVACCHRMLLPVEKVHDFIRSKTARHTDTGAHRCQKDQGQQGTSSRVWPVFCYRVLASSFKADSSRRLCIFFWLPFCGLSGLDGS